MTASFCLRGALGLLSPHKRQLVTARTEHWAWVEPLHNDVTALIYAVAFGCAFLCDEPP